VTVAGGEGGNSVVRLQANTAAIAIWARAGDFCHDCCRISSHSREQKPGVWGCGWRLRCV